MSGYAITMLIWVLILVAAVPYVNRIRHPDQKPLAAYLIFMLTLLIAATVIYNVLAMAAAALGVTPAFENVSLAVLFLIMVYVPAFLVARWMASKPPSRSMPL